MNRLNYRRGLVRNLRIIWLHRICLHSFGFPIATIVLFFQEFGLKLSEVFLLEAIFAVSLALLEVPSGYVADCLGRKKTLIAGSASAMLAAIIYLSSNGFYGFLTAEICIGLSLALISGADQALVYDSLVELKLEHKFARLWSKVSSIELAGNALILLVGGFVGAFNYRLPFVLTVIGFAVLTWNAFRFVEPKRQKLTTTRGHMRELGSIAFECLFRRKTLAWLIFSGAALHMFNQAGFWLYQPLLKLRGVPEIYFGLIYASLGLAAAAMASKVYKLEEKFGFLTTVVLAALVGAVGYYMLAKIEAHWGLVFILSFQFIRVVNRVLFDHQLNKLIDSEFRATALSIKNMAQGLSYCLLLLALGPTVDDKGPVFVFYILGACLLLSTLLIIAAYPNKKRVLAESPRA